MRPARRPAALILSILPALLPACGGLAGPGDSPRQPPPLDPHNNAFVLPPPISSGPGGSSVDSPVAEAVLRPPRSSLVMAVLHLRVPESRIAAIEPVWKVLHEDVGGAESQLRLRQNGMRVGVGHVQHWESIQRTLDGVEGSQLAQSTPVRVPAGFPLSLELEREPRDQTIFWTDADGSLSGGTYKGGRNILRIVYEPDPRRPRAIQFQAAPEVHQAREGWRWVRTAEGPVQVPRQQTDTILAASVTLSLEPGEFVVVAPSDRANLEGLLGREFFTRDEGGVRYWSYFFLRPEVEDVGQRTETDDD